MSHTRLGTSRQIVLHQVHHTGTVNNSSDDKINALQTQINELNLRIDQLKIVIDVLAAKLKLEIEYPSVQSAKSI